MLHLEFVTADMSQHCHPVYAILLFPSGNETIFYKEAKDVRAAVSREGRVDHFLRPQQLKPKKPRPVDRDAIHPCRGERVSRPLLTDDLKNQFRHRPTGRPAGRDGIAACWLSKGRKNRLILNGAQCARGWLAGWLRPGRGENCFPKAEKRRYQLQNQTFNGSLSKYVRNWPKSHRAFAILTFPWETPCSKICH